MSQSILIVDDEPDILSSMARILRSNGYTVDTATSLAKAADRTCWADYFAVLLDRKLPDGMSDDLVPKLKQLAPDASIIVITAYADLESSLASLRNGVEDYLLKPIAPDAVLHRLRRVQEMQRAKQRAIQSERLAAIGEMLSAIAHESRNALQRISVGVDLLRLGVDENSEAARDLARIDRGRSDLQALLDEIRTYAAPINLNVQKCDLTDVWQRAWHDLAVIRENRQAELLEETDSVNLQVPVDTFRFEQIFRNLIENSFAACKDPVQIQIGCTDSELEGVPALCVTVKDNGPGLSDEQKSRIGEAFFTTKPEGTGLGMAIAKRIIEAHSGTLTVGNGECGGAEFKITLPRAN